MSGRAFVDTNVLVYAVDQADPHKQHRARQVLAGDGKTELIVSAQVLSEFYVTVTRKLAQPLDARAARAMVDELTQMPTVVLTADLVRSAIAGSQEWQCSYWDALVLRAAESAGCDIVLSEDLGDARSYGSVRVENPFTATV